MALKRSIRGGLSLIEIMVSAAILAVALMGLMSSFLVVQKSQAMMKEQTAAVLACQSMIDEIKSFTDLNYDSGTGFPNVTIFAYDETGFDIYNVSYANGGGGSMGRAVDYSASTSGSQTSSVVEAGNLLRPAAASMFPTSRASKSAAVKAAAGYIEADEVPNRTLVKVNIVVAWKTFGGDTRVTFAVLVAPSV